MYKYTKEFCKDYLSDFEEADVAVFTTLSDIENERAKSQRELELEGHQKHNFSPEYLETLALYRKIAEALIDYNIILFHGSAVAVDGTAYLFTAKSGTGKSTHTRLWREVFGNRTVMINDDKPLIKINEGAATVYGTPWNGKHALGSNTSVRLGAICILERDEVNRIKKANAIKEFPAILSQTYRTSNPHFMKKTLALLDKLLSTTPIYRLGCNMDREAAIVSYNGMRGKENEA